MTDGLTFAASAAFSWPYACGQQVERLLRVVGDEVDARRRDLGQVGPGRIERLLAGVGRADRLLRRVATEGVDGEPEATDDDDQGEDGQRRPTLGLAPRRRAA